MCLSPLKNSLFLVVSAPYPYSSSILEGNLIREEEFYYFLGFFIEVVSGSIVGCTANFLTVFFFFSRFFGLLSPISNTSFLPFHEAKIPTVSAPAPAPFPSAQPS